MDLNFGMTTKAGSRDQAGHFPCEVNDGYFGTQRHQDEKGMCIGCSLFW